MVNGGGGNGGGDAVATFGGGVWASKMLPMQISPMSPHLHSHFG